MRILVTGGAGFIGSYVTDALRVAGHEPVVFDHRSRQLDAEQILGSVRDRESVAEAVAHVHGVIHLAAVLGTSETISDPFPAVETNVLGTLHVLEAARHYNVPVVYAAVGNHWMRSLGGGTYTITKSCAEDFCAMYARNLGVPVSVVRPVNAYGPGQSVSVPWGSSRVRKIIPTFIHQALNGKPVEVYGDGTQVSDMVYVSDVARAFVFALDHDGPFEIGPAEHPSVNEIAQLVIDEVATQTGAESRISHLPMRSGEIPGETTADTTSLREAGFDLDLIPLAEGIRRTVQHYAKESQ